MTPTRTSIVRHDSALLFEPVAAVMARIKLSDPFLAVGGDLLAVRAELHHLFNGAEDGLCPDRIHGAIIHTNSADRTSIHRTREGAGGQAHDGRFDLKGHLLERFS